MRRLWFSATLLLPLLLVTVLCAAPPAGTALTLPRRGTAMASWSDTLAQIGVDGPAAWHWPSLPGDEVVYRTSLHLPANLRLHGLRISHAGTTNSMSDTLRLTLRDAQQQVLLDSTVLLPGGGGEAGDLLFSREILMNGGGNEDWLWVDLLSRHPASAPWITADDDCHSGNAFSWIRVGGASSTFQPLDRDLNIRALVEWTDGIGTGPDVRVADAPGWNRVLPGMPLRVRVRDEDGIDTVMVGASNVPNWAVGLERQGSSSQDAHWEEWTVLLQPSAIASAGDDHLALEILAVDSLGNQSVVSVWSQEDAVLHWGPATGRDDQAWQPGQPLTPGAALAQRIPLGRLREDNGLISAVVSGARLQARGPGEVLLRLVQDVNGLPGHSDAGWVEMADSLLFSLGASCGGAVEMAFSNPVQGLSQGDQVWLLLDYSLPAHAFAAPAPLLEWFGPEGRPADSLCHSWAWNPLEEEWLPIPSGTLLLDARLEAETCDYNLPFVADFDATFADLQCWQEEHAPSSVGWVSGTDASANSPCYLPGGAAFDPDNLKSGSFLLVNSDAQGAGVAQADTLFTPWLRTSDGARLVFSSCMGFSSPDNAAVLWRQRTDGSFGAWEVALGMTDMLALGDSVVCGIQHPLWNRIEHTLAAAGTEMEFQVAFAFQSSFGTGWAIDSVRIVSPALAAPSPWEGSRQSVVELGRAHPNPFNPECVLPWRLLRGGPARLEVFNLLGQRVALLVDEPARAAGEYRAIFRPGSLASGVYIARLESAGFVDCRRLVYLK